MTRQHSKYIAGAILASLLLPSLSFAADGAMLRTTASGTPRGGENFCTHLDATIGNLEQRMGEREGKLTEKRTERTSKIKEKQTLRDTDRTNHRDSWDANRVALYAKLDAKASTTEQKAAIDAFKAAIDAAVALRRAAVDKAVGDYRTALDKAVTDRQTAVDTALAAFRAAREAAIAKAKTDCVGGVTPSTARIAFMAAMKNAQDELKASVKALEERKDTLTPLALARKADVEKAVTDFKVAVEVAKTKLKASYDVKANVK